MPRSQELKITDHNYDEEDRSRLLSEENIELVSGKLEQLRKRLLDFSRRNPLVDIKFRPNSTSVLRVVDELPDVLKHRLAAGRSMRLKSLPALEDELPDEHTEAFQEALLLARQNDETYRAEIGRIDPANGKVEDKALRAERSLKDRLRVDLGLPSRQTKDDLSLAQHAKNHGIDPSYVLPLPENFHDDGRHDDDDIQTLLLPDTLSRTAKSILEKGRSFERETGVNVLHACFGLLEWQSPDERDRYLSPLLLLEIRVERRQSPQGAEFYVAGAEQVAVNTTLAQKFVVEHGLVLPAYETGGVEGYFEAVSGAAPKGWHWRVRREVAVGIFPSSKLAMYHDLDPAKRALATNEMIARLLASTGVGDGAYAATYEIDRPEVAAKVPYLVMDADASQYSALVDVADGKDLALEGPPGSGKSQSIVNMIAAALADSKKVLFVAEKMTALDVVKNRLDAAGLGRFILPLQAGRGSSDTIYESIRERIEMARSDDRARQSYVMRQSALEKHRAILQGYLDALGTTYGHTGMTVYQVIGHGIATSETRDDLPREVRRLRLPDADLLNPEAIDDLVAEVEAFAQRVHRIANIPKLWRHSGAAINSRNDAEDMAAASSDLASLIDDFGTAVGHSRIAPFLAEGPFESDLGAVRSLVDELATHSHRIDVDRLNVFGGVEQRRQTLELCTHIREHRSTSAKLCELLKAPTSRNILQDLEDAETFAKIHEGRIDPAQFARKQATTNSELVTLDAQISTAVALPELWTSGSRALSSLQADARRLLSAPEEILRLRKGDPAKAIPAAIEQFVAQIETLQSELARIRQELPHAGRPHRAEEISRAAGAIENSGAFRLFSGTYKSARGTYVETLGGRATETRVEMVSHLRAYAHWLDRKLEFEAESVHAARYGTIYNGLSTDPAALWKVAQFHELVDEISQGSSELKSWFETANLGPLRNFADATEMPKLTLDQVMSKFESLTSRLAVEIDQLEAAKAHLALFKGCTSITARDIADVIELKTKEAELSRLISSSPCKTFIGAAFASLSTNIELLEVECQLAETLATAPYFDHVIDILSSGTANAVLREIEDLITRHQVVEMACTSLIRDLNLSAALATTPALARHVDDLRAAAANPGSLVDQAHVLRTEKNLRARGLGVILDWAMGGEAEANLARLGPVVRAVIASTMVAEVYEIHQEALEGYDGEEFDRIRTEIAEKDRELIQMSRRVVADQLVRNADPPTGNSFGAKAALTDMSLIFNELHKKKRRIGLRELTRRAGHALLELKPCWMVSPLAVAQYLRPEMCFDLVIIDEASQMTPENAIGALSRAGQAVIVGDSKQLPPTSFFQRLLDDEEVDEDFREDSESILDMANVTFMPIRQLRWHYRSKHSGLIQFSNHWLYKGELTIFPSAQEDHPDLGVKLIEVQGTYRTGSRTNETEARAVVEAAIRHMETRPELSLGICALNIEQKTLIIEEFERVRDRSRKVQAYIEHWETKHDALEEFFIKNLETIQGDERDVMFISTVYGPEISGGPVHQRWGPINSAQGHRRLNVLFTRAKRKMVTFTSLKPTDIVVDEKKNLGVRMFRAWLEYCKTGHVPELGGSRELTESPFEDYVKAQIERLGCEAIPQVGVAGFRVDLGVRHPEWPYGYILGVECDGEPYHSSKSSRDRDRLRQEILESLGWRLHRIWSTDWFRNAPREIERLKEEVSRALDHAKTKGATHAARLEPTEMPSRTTEQAIGHPAATSRGASTSAAPPLGRRPEQTSLPFDTLTGSEASSAPVALPIIANSGPMVVTAALGSRLKIEHITDGGKKLAFTLVEGENDPDQGRVGIHTPLGRALIDAQIGDEVEYQVGSRIKEVRVLEIT